jgi:uncharacterized protein
MKRAFAAVFIFILLSLCVNTGYGAESAVKGLTFISNKPGGTWFVLISGYAGVLRNALGGANIRVDASTGGSQQNVQLIQMKEGDFSMGGLRDTYEAFNGMGYHKGRSAPDLRAVFVLSRYSAIEHIIAKANIPVQSFGGFDGRTFNAGVAGGAQDYLVRSRSEILGIKPKVQNMTITDAIDRLKDGLIDGIFHGGGIPVAGVVDLCTTHGDKIKFVGYTDEEAKKILAAQPGYFRAEIPANSYKGQTETIKTIADGALVLTHKDIPEDIVYKFVSRVFTDVKEVAAIHPTAGPLDPQDIARSSIPVHPGALKFYREKGISAPTK